MDAPCINTNRAFIIRWYSAMIILACLMGLWLARKEAEKNGIGPKKIDDFFLYAIIGAIIGARLYYISFSDPAQLWKDPFYVIAVWKGGLAIHGAMLGGLLIAVLYARKQKISKNQVHFPNTCFFKNF